LDTFGGAPGRTRTFNPRLRRPMLYPVELQALMIFADYCGVH
jgi:hypothetical protein